MRILLIFIVLAALLGCSPETPSGPSQAAQKKPPPHLVELLQVKTSREGQRLQRTGTLKAEQEVKILPQEEGLIESIPFREGDRVQAKAVLLRLNDDELGAEFKKAKAQRRQAELDLLRLKGLQGRQVISEEELARAETALDIARAEEELLQLRLNHATIRAPFAGVISQRLAEPGDVVQRFDHVLSLTDLGSLYTELSVSELMLSDIQVGDAVQLSIDALGNQRFPGKISRIHPTIDPLTRQGLIEISPTPVPAGARPGQLCRVELHTRERERLLIPFSALRRDPEGEYVFGIDEQQHSTRIAVRSGRHFGDRVEILEGLEPGSTIIARGFLNLAPGKPVTPVGQAGKGRGQRP